MALLVAESGRRPRLAGHTLLSLAGALLLLLSTGLALWLGAASAGSAGLTWWDVVRAIANLLPIVVLTAGLAVATFGALPRLTVSLPVAYLVMGLVASMLGPALHWPRWAGSGALLVTHGMVGFQRRDLSTRLTRFRGRWLSRSRAPAGRWRPGPRGR